MATSTEPQREPPEQSKNPEQQAWENARELVRHEDELTHHRFTACLSIQAFLFAATMLGASNAVQNDASRAFWTALLLPICVLGAVTCWVTLRAIWSAHIHVHATRLWLKKYRENAEVQACKYRDKCPYPSLIGHRPRIRWLFWYEADDAYKDELQFDEADYKSLTTWFKREGDPLLVITVFAVWVLFALLAIGMLVVAWSSPPVKGVTRTAITVIEDGARQEATVSFKGNVGNIPDLGRRLQALPPQAKSP